MDLVRMILMRLESTPSGWAPQDLGIKSFPADQIGYHAHIMMQEGLIEGTDATLTASSGPEVLPTNLMWKGHEFLDLARDQDRWNRAKAIVAKVGGAPISVWMKILTDLMLQGVDSVGTKLS
jgi:hypothetical protein